MRFLTVIAALSLVLGALPVCSSAQDNTVYSQSSEDDIRQQIERNWNVDVNALGACGEPVELRIMLAPDYSGEVTGVEILPGLPDTAPCKAIAQSARRAVLISSPLKLPAGNSLSSIRLRFQPDFLEN
jgi:hypothetical protein